MKITIPRYQQIAADVAAKIATGHYKEGEKIYARYSLASQFAVYGKGNCYFYSGWSASDSKLVALESNHADTGTC